MAEQVVEPRIRGFISLTAHPEGCAANVRHQVALARAGIPSDAGRVANALVIGCSTGYGLASLLVSTFGLGAKTLGVCFEKTSSDGKPGTAGWYNMAEATRLARAEGRTIEVINDDAFAAETKQEVVARLRERFGPLDLVIYSLASPRRSNPAGGHWNSVLKPIGAPYTGPAFDLRREEVSEAHIEPATDEEIAETVKVMGGEDWTAWIDALREADLLAEGARTVAYSYIGPDVSAPIYRHGTIGRAKEHLEATARDLERTMQAHCGGHAWVSINKGVVTQASAAIPAVPLYLSILFKVMKEEGLHEGPIEQIVRLFRDHLAPSREPVVDEERRIRLDDWEMRPEVQARVAEAWGQIVSGNLDELTDYAGYKRDFAQLFGFGVEGVDYAAPTEVHRELA